MNRMELRLKLVEELTDRLCSEVNKDATEEQKICFLEEMAIASIISLEGFGVKKALWITSSMTTYLLNNPTLTDDLPPLVTVPEPLDEPEVKAAKVRKDLN